MSVPKKNKNTSFALDPWYPYALTVIIAFFIADLTVLSVRSQLLPSGIAPGETATTQVSSMKSLSQYSDIPGRNIFSLDGSMPDPINAGPAQNDASKDAPAVISQLPLNLVGTMVFSNAEKSLATIELKGKNLVVSVGPGAEVENLARIESVERHKVIFMNLNNGAKEYIEMKTDNKVSFGASKPNVGSVSKEVVATGTNEFAIKRADLLKYTTDLPSILMQARAVPYMAPGTNEVTGYRLLDMQPGSIYEQLGLKRMDIIKGANGNLVNSPAKAMELFGALKNENSVNITVERNGKTETIKYNIQ